MNQLCKIVLLLALVLIVDRLLAQEQEKPNLEQLIAELQTQENQKAIQEELIQESQEKIVDKLNVEPK